MWIHRVLCFCPQENETKLKLEERLGHMLSPFLKEGLPAWGGEALSPWFGMWRKGIPMDLEHV